MGAVRNRLKARAAESVHRHGWPFDGKTDLESHVSGEVYRIRGRLLCIPEHHVTYLAGLGTGALQGVTGGDCPELGGGMPLERSTESSEPSPDTG